MSTPERAESHKRSLAALIPQPVATRRCALNAVRNFLYGTCTHIARADIVDAVANRIPNFFIVGAPKCGTTSMVEYLRVHPQIFMPKRKDLYYFGSDLDLAVEKMTENEYLAYFAEAGAARWVGECSVQYLRSERAPHEIAQWCDDPRVIIMLRNPADFLFSYHGQLVYHGDEDILDFEQAIGAQADRRAGRRIPAGCHAPSRLQYFEVAAFDRHVARWFDALGRERVHVIILEDMQRDTPGTYRRTLEWLGVDAGFQPDFSRQNEKRWLTAPHAIQILRRAPVLRTLMIKFVPSGLRRKTGGVLSKAMRTPEREPMRREFREELLQHFQPSIDKLSELLGRDLSYWYRKAEPAAVVRG